MDPHVLAAGGGARARARRVGSDSNGVDELHHHRHGPDRRRVADAHGRATIVTNVETEFKNHSTLGRGRRRGDGEDERKNPRGHRGRESDERDARRGDEEEGLRTRLKGFLRLAQTRRGRRRTRERFASIDTLGGSAVELRSVGGRRAEGRSRTR